MPLEILTMLELDGYGRFSSDGQKDGTSEQRQRDGCASAAKKLGARLHMLPFERGVSARLGGNLEPGTVLGNYMVEALQGKKRGRVFCTESQDRISRDKPTRALAFLLNLVSSGVTVHFWGSGETVDSEAGVRELLRPLLDAENAHKENETRRGRVIESIDIRRGFADDVFVARVPDWLTVPRKTRKHERRPRSAITFVPGRREIVQQIFEWTAQGDGGIVIASRLNELVKTNPRYRPWRGEKWNSDVISNITTNRAVLGEYQPCRTRPDLSKPVGPRGKRPIKREKLAVIVDYYPAAIGHDLWTRAQGAKAKMDV